jgi:hypothetical protein
MVEVAEHTKLRKMICSSLTPWEMRTSIAFKHDPPVAWCQLLPHLGEIIQLTEHRVEQEDVSLRNILGQFGVLHFSSLSSNLGRVSLRIV